MEAVNATDASRNFSDLLNRVAYRNESLEIHRGGRSVARLIPAGPAVGVKAKELRRILSGLPGLDVDAADFKADVDAARMPPEGDPWVS